MTQTGKRVSPEGFFTSSIVCGYFDGALFHTAHSGNGVIYLVHDGRIQRITENLDIQSYDDPGLTEEMGRKSLLGYDAIACRAGFASLDIVPGDTILLCSDGVAGRVDSMTMLDSTLNSATPEENVDRITRRAISRGATEDISIVAVTFEGPDDEPPVFARNLFYPTKIRTAKIAIPLLLLIFISASLVSGFLNFAPEQIQENANMPLKSLSAENTGGEVTIQQKSDATIISKPEEVIINVETQPAGAAIYLNGRAIGGKSPVELKLKKGEHATLRATLDGYMEHLETVYAPEDADTFSVKFKMLKIIEPPGSINITCDDRCDSITIDGTRIEGVLFPRATVTKNISSGTHVIEASRGREFKTQTVSIKPDSLTKTHFDFSSAGNERVGNEPRSQAPPTAPSPAKAQPSQPVNKIVASSKSRTDDSIVVHTGAGDGSQTGGLSDAGLKKVNRVKTATDTGAPAESANIVIKTASAGGEVAGGRVKFFQGGRLAGTGYTGETIKLPAGTYEFQITKDDFETYTSSKYFGAGQNTISVYLSR